MKNVITLDIESFYSKTYSLSKMTTQEYILDPQFETIGVGVIVDGERLWCSGTHAQIQKFLNQFDWEKSALLAQNCLTGDHEVRTPEGWVRLDMLKDEQQVLQWDPVTNKSNYVIPRAVIRKQHIGTMLKWDTSFHKGIYTPDHRMYYRTPSSDEWKVGTALEVSKMGANNVYVPMAGEYEVGTPLELTEPMARLMEAIRADGHVTPAGRVRFKFTKQRKIERLRALLDSMGIGYREYPATNPVCTAFDLDRCSLLEYVVETLTTSGSKGYGPWALRMSIAARKALLDEVQYWDGYVADNLRGKGTNRKTVLHTANKTDALWLYEMAVSVGLCAKVQYDLPNTRGWSKPGSVLHMVSIRTKSKVKTLVAPETVDYDGMVYCVSVPTGAFVVRREGAVWATGNCMFDAAILAWHYGIHPMILLDTLAMSRALYPHEKSHSLAKQAERHGIGEKGTEVLNALGKRRADFTPDELAKYGEYCLNDCDLTLALAKLYLPRFKKSELKLIDSTLRMYTEPVFVLDEDKLHTHASNLKTIEGIALTRVMGILNLDTSVTEDDIKRLLASNQKFAGVLEAFGVEPPMKLSPTTGKMAYAFAKTDEEFTALEAHENPDVQALVKARLGTKSTIEETRTQRLIDCAQMAQEVPIAMRFYGAWCVTGDVEVLTRYGWAPLEEWQGGDIMQYHADTNTMEFLPAGKYVGPMTCEWIDIDAPYMKGSFTKGHTMPYLMHGTKKFASMKAGEFISRTATNVPIAGYFETDQKVYSADQMRLIAATQADGHYEYESPHRQLPSRLKFRFNKTRKVDRLVELLTKLGIRFTKTNYASEPQTTTIRIPMEQTTPLSWLFGWKNFDHRLLAASVQARQDFLKELVHWDGWHQNGSDYYISTDRGNADMVALVAHSVGMSATPQVKPGRNNRKDTWVVALRKRTYAEIRKNHVVEVQEARQTFCATTQTGFWLARSRGTIFVTGNTGRWSADSAGATNFQNMPRTSPIKNAICAPAGYVVCGADLSNIELRLGLWLAGQWDKVELIRAGRDLYKDLAAKVNGVPYDEVPKDMRQTYKVVQLSSIYQTGPARLKDTLRIMAKQNFDLEEAKRMIYAYREDNKAVVQAWDDCHHALVSIAEKRTGDLTLFRGLVKWDWDVQGFLLPSGLHLQMPNLRVELNDAGKKQFVFDGAYGPEKTYGGKLFQGLTQALARCIIAEGWLRINKKYTIKLSVHDSLYWLAPENEAQASLDWGIEQMTAPISWCADLPLGAEGSFGPTLGDA